MGLAETLLERIHKLVDDHGITVNTLLKDCGINRNMVSDLKGRGSIPSADKLNKLADYFGVTTDYLLGRSDNRYPAESVAASSDTGYDLPQEALDELEEYKRFLRMKYGKK